MTAIAATIQSFFTDHLVKERNASPATIAAYRDAIKLLINYAAERTATKATALDFAQIDATLLLTFLEYLEHERGNSVRTRNARLAAIHALTSYAARRHPEHADYFARIHAVTGKRAAHTEVTYLTDPELSALIEACDTGTRIGRRDRVMIHLAAQTGLRCAELLSLTPADLHLGNGAHVSCRGKGRKTRVTPLTSDTTALLRSHLDENQPETATTLFTTTRGRPLSRDALAQRLSTYTTTAAANCPSLTRKNITPHVLRHTAAMRLLHAGVDIAVIALWLGHESLNTTAIYLKADLETKEKAIARTAPIGTPPGRFRPDDALLAFLNDL
jgi:site-specific recombinase XerD